MGDHTREGAGEGWRQAPDAGEGLHPEFSFVVQLRGLPGDELTGRVEHVVSGEVARFRTTAELVAFLRGCGRQGAA